MIYSFASGVGSHEKCEMERNKRVQLESNLLTLGALQKLDTKARFCQGGGLGGERVNHLPGAGSEGEAERGGAGEALCFLWPPSALEGTGGEGGEAAKRRDPAFVSYPPPGDKTGGEGGWG